MIDTTTIEAAYKALGETFEERRPELEGPARLARKVLQEFLELEKGPPLPELPKAEATYADHSYPKYTHQQMIEYAKAAQALAMVFYRDKGQA